jgi:hypothetical protein
MKNFIVNSQEEFEKLLAENKNFINGNLVARECNLKTNSSIEVRGNIKADGSIGVSGDIKAGWFIEASGSIIAGGSIKAGLFIKAGWFIEAGRFIETGQFVGAGEFIKAGSDIKAGWYIHSFVFDISCKYFKTKILPFWREYWASQLPLQKWKKEILDDNYCWNDLRNLPTESEKVEICDWEGWHWILKGHLECFFGLKDRIYLSKE